MSEHFVHTTSTNKSKSNFYPTPPEATKALLERLPIRLAGAKVWEPACGNGAISKVLKKAGYSVISTDLNNHGYGQTRIDFLLEWRKIDPDCNVIITNPPFDLGTEFLERALDLGHSDVFFLCRLAFLEGVSRKELHEKHLSRVMVFSNRLQMKRHGYDGGKGGGSMIAFAWYHWTLQRPSSATVEFI